MQKLAQLPKTFSGEKLKKAREAQGMRREELAVQACVGVDAVRRWEIGLTEPDASRLKILAKHLGKDLDFFFVSEKMLSQR